MPVSLFHADKAQIKPQIYTVIGFIIIYSKHIKAYHLLAMLTCSKSFCIMYT